MLDQKTSAQPGQWKTSTTPYLEGVMNAYNDPNIEEIIFCKPTQVGGTEALNNMIAYIIAQDPNSTLVVYPTLELAEFTAKNRIQPMVDLSKQLKERYQISASTIKEMQFDGMYLVLAGANSAASLASRPAKNVLLDEVDKYPAFSGKEADPISLAKERTKTYQYTKKIFMTSTPTLASGNIWQAFKRADEIRYYHVPCPHCGCYQPLEFKQIKKPDGVENLADIRELAYYQCIECGRIINDSHKMNMLRNGVWQSDGRSGRSVAFHLNTIYSPWVRFGDVLYEFFKSRHFPDLLQNFINSWLAEPWEDTKLKMNSDVIYERQDVFEPGVVPDEAFILTGGVDVQKNKLYWTIRAWGPYYTSWNVAHGEALCFEDIEQIMNAEYSKQNGERYQVALCCVDSGDQTEDVYDFCYMNSEWAKPVKGASNQMAFKYRITTIDRAGSRSHGSTLIMVDTYKYKNFIADRMCRDNGQGSWMVHKDIDLDYAKQVTAEHRVLEKRGSQEVEVWRTKTAHADNHYLDCEVYAAVAADLANVRELGFEAQREEKTPVAAEEQTDRWIKKEEWLK